MEKIIAKILPKLIAQKTNNIRLGIITSVRSQSRTASVVIIGTNEKLNGIKYSKGITNVAINNTCMIISTDPNNKGRNYIIGVF